MTIRQTLMKELFGCYRKQHDQHLLKYQWAQDHAREATTNMIRKIIFRIQAKKEVHKAKEANKITGKKFFVIIYKGRPVCISKQQVKFWIKTRRLAKGTTIQDVEKRALFVT